MLSKAAGNEIQFDFVATDDVKELAENTIPSGKLGTKYFCSNFSNEKGLDFSTKPCKEDIIGVLLRANLSRSCYIIVEIAPVVYLIAGKIFVYCRAV